MLQDGTYPNDDYDDCGDDCMYDYEDHCNDIPARVRVSLQVLDLCNDVPNQVATLAYDVIVKFLKEDTNV
jgi:hypothetical protein